MAYHAASSADTGLPPGAEGCVPSWYFIDQSNRPVGVTSAVGRCPSSVTIDRAEVHMLLHCAGCSLTGEHASGHGAESQQCEQSAGAAAATGGAECVADVRPQP